jgi:hypothetical protein
MIEIEKLIGKTVNNIIYIPSKYLGDNKLYIEFTDGTNFTVTDGVDYLTSQCSGLEFEIIDKKE